MRRLRLLRHRPWRYLCVERRRYGHRLGVDSMRTTAGRYGNVERIAY